MTPAYYAGVAAGSLQRKRLFIHACSLKSWRLNQSISISTYLGVSDNWCEHWHHMQGQLVLKDFNIQEAAGNSFIGIVKTFVAQVRNGVLDIHLFYAGKGTCCMPDGRWSFGPLISAISAKNVLNREDLEPFFCLVSSSTILGCQLM